MSKEKPILQYWGDGRSQRQTATSLGVSRNTVSSVIAAALHVFPVLQALQRLR